MAFGTKSRGEPTLTPFPAVRAEVDDHPALASTLLRALKIQRDELCARVVAGQPQSFEQYRYLLGQIEGLTIAITICEKTQGQLSA